MNTQALDEIIARMIPILPGDCKRSKAKKEWMRQEARERLIAWALSAGAIYYRLRIDPQHLAMIGDDGKPEAVIDEEYIKKLTQWPTKEQIELLYGKGTPATITVPDLPPKEEDIDMDGLDLCPAMHLPKINPHQPQTGGTIYGPLPAEGGTDNPDREEEIIPADRFKKGILQGPFIMNNHDPNSRLVLLSIHQISQLFKNNPISDDPGTTT